MLKIQKLKRPNKRSGHPLSHLATTRVRGVEITNLNSFTIYVDRWQRKKKKGKK